MLVHSYMSWRVSVRAMILIRISEHTNVMSYGKKGSSLYQGYDMGSHRSKLLSITFSITTM